MTSRDGESSTDVDPSALLFGADDDADFPATGPHETRPSRPPWRRQPNRRHRRNARLSLLLVVVVLVVVAAVVVPWAINRFRVADYSGNGTGRVRVRIPAGATASDIATILDRRGVVASVQAFTNAAEDNSRSTDIQPGTYTLHRHMSGQAALALLLTPSARDASSDVVVPEGATVVDVEKRLVQVLGPARKQTVLAALHHPKALGLPLGYGRNPVSAEGFLYPATYSLDPGSTASDALQLMVARFAAADRSLTFAASAKQLGLTPYQALTIASIAQAEAKYPQDMPKVARVVLNRLRADRPLQIDATSAYRAKLAGVDPSTVIYSQVSGPYNTYKHPGLPPTPIDNPGADALRAAVHPASGSWLFYVNSDASGHLFFTHSENDFAKAVARCRAQHWGCG